MKNSLFVSLLVFFTSSLLAQDFEIIDSFGLPPLEIRCTITSENSDKNLYEISWKSNYIDSIAASKGELPYMELHCFVYDSKGLVGYYKGLKAVSAKDMQQRLGMKRYEPVWYMMQKIRLAMGKANESVKLDGTVEFDDGFFRAEKKEKDLYQQLFNRGRGSERTQPVLVAVQRVTRSKSKKRNDMEENTRAGRLRMEHLPDFSGMTYGVLAKRLLTKQAVVLSDANPSYNAIQPHVERHQPSKTDPKKAAKALPWVHIAISNAKRVFLGIYHSISDCWLQCYLNEFCFKFNRRFERHISVNQLFTVIATNQLH
jgi:hypothetical protein